MPYSCFIHSSVDGHLDRFYILAIVNNDAMNIEVFVFFQLVFWFPLDVFAEVGLLGQRQIHI